MSVQQKEASVCTAVHLMLVAPPRSPCRRSFCFIWAALLLFTVVTTCRERQEKQAETQTAAAAGSKTGLLHEKNSETIVKK